MTQITTTTRFSPFDGGGVGAAIISPVLTGKGDKLTSDTGGVDFSSLQLNYFTDFSDEEISGLSYFFRANKVKPGANEHKFQPWFQKNAWVLGSDCVRILDARKIDVRNIADLLVEAYDFRADIVELKRPGLGFWQAEKDHDNYLPHPDLVAMIIQAQNYQFALEGEIDSIKTRERLKGIPIAKPCSLLIHGRSNEWVDKQFEAQRLLNAGFTNLNVITYDQVLRRAKIIMGCKT